MQPIPAITSDHTDLAEHARRMDHLYRLWRHVYDPTRAVVLVGRDALIEAVPGEARMVVEVGCGTARNLRRLARRLPRARLYGVDISSAMLATAARRVARGGFSDRITLVRAAAERLDEAPGGLPGQADVVFFSYSLSMMPGWRVALDAALRLVRPGGQVLIVDFWDLAGWPPVVRRVIRRWVSLFGVSPRDDLHARLCELQQQGRIGLTVRGLRGRYAYLATLTRCGGVA